MGSTPAVWAASTKSAADGGGKVLAHLQNVRRELGRLCEYGRIQIAELPAAFAHERGNVTQQCDAVRALVARVGIRKMLADVTERERTEQGIHDGVREHIRVRVPQQPQGVGHLHPAQDQPPPLHQTVYIIAVSNAQHHSSPLSLASRMASPTTRSKGVVSLRFSRLPG